MTIAMVSILLISSFAGVSVAQTSNIESNLADNEIEFDNAEHSAFSVDNQTYRIAELEFDVSSDTSTKDLSFRNAGDSGYQTGIIGVASDGSTTEIDMLISASTATSVDLSQYDQIIVQQMVDVNAVNPPIIVPSTSLSAESLEQSPSVSTGDSIGDTISDPIQLRNPGTQFGYDIIETSTGSSMASGLNQWPSPVIGPDEHFSVSESSVSSVNVEVWVVEQITATEYNIADPVGIDFTSTDYVDAQINTGQNVTEINQIELEGPVPTDGRLEPIKISTPDGDTITMVENNGTVDLEQGYDTGNVTVTVFTIVDQESTIKGNNVDRGIIGGAVSGDSSNLTLDNVDNQTLGVGLVGIVALLGVIVAARD